MPFLYQPKSIKQLKDSYSRRVKQEVNGFLSFDEFINWYNTQELICNYCGLTEEEMQEISMTEILTSKRFPQNGVVGQGKNRAVWLEVDRINPNGLYSRENCVLSCYFCNNDKSDVFSGESYMSFFQNRANFLRQILERARQNI